MRQFEKTGQPLGIGLAPELERFGVITSANHRHQRRDDHGFERITDALWASRVGKRR